MVRRWSARTARCGFQDTSPRAAVGVPPEASVDAAHHSIEGARPAVHSPDTPTAVRNLSGDREPPELSGRRRRGVRTSRRTWPGAMPVRFSTSSAMTPARNNSFRFRIAWETGAGVPGSRLY